MRFSYLLANVMIQAIQNSVDIINARVPGYKDLQMLLVNQEGIIEQILPMDTVGLHNRASVIDQDLCTENLKPRSPLTPLKKGGTLKAPFLRGLGDLLCVSPIDVTGDWISLGGVDLQINGALGLAFPDLKAENTHQLQKISQFLWDEGVDGFLPTLVTTSVENIQRSLAVIADIIPCQQTGAKILGVHLEGPFLNYQKRGAHPAEYLLPLTIDEVKRVLGDYATLVKVITLAPELDPTDEVIPYLRSLGIIVSLGHSQATATQAQRAFELGATMVTHAFNAMPSLHHREPGLLGVAITHPHVMCGFIADGEHVSPTILQILLRASNYEKGLFLVSDALAPLGLPDGVYPWDSRQIAVKNGTARLADGTLSGTTLPLLVGVQNLVKWGICDVENAILLATDAPRQAMAPPTPRANALPGIAKSQAANLLRWHWDEVTKDLTWQRLLG